MSDLWMPAQAEANLHAEYSSRAEAKRVQDFTNRLEAVDPRLRCFLATQSTEDGAIVQGFYYIVRRNEDGTTATWQVQNPDGSFREPDERDVQALRETDLWKRGAKERLRGKAEANRKMRQREAERKREETREKFKDLADYRFRTQIPVTRKIS